MRIGLNSPQAFLALVIRRRWWIIAPFVALTCMVLVLTKSLPKVYVSKTLILVKPREVPSNFVVDLIAGSVEERLRSIEQTVMSRTNLVDIIREFGDQLPELQRLNQDAKVEKLRGQINIAFTTGSVVNGVKQITYFTISYENQNPVLAQKIASKLTRLFIAQDGAVRESQVVGTKDFFSRELLKVSSDLQESEARLKGMRAARQYELPERLDTNLRRLENLGQDSRTVEEAIGRNITQRLNTNELLAQTQPTIPKPIASTGGSSSSAATPAAPPEDQKILDYRKLKQQYEQVTAVYGERYPDSRTLRAMLDQSQKKTLAGGTDNRRKPS